MFIPKGTGAGTGMAAPYNPRIGGVASSFMPFEGGGDQNMQFGMRRAQLAPGLGIAGGAASNPWLGLAQALNAHMAGRSGVGAGGMFGGGFGSAPAVGGVPSRHTIYGAGPRAF